MSSKKNLTPSERIQANQREKLRGFMKGILNLFGKYINSPFQIPNLLQQLTQTKEFNSFTEQLGLRFVNEVKVWNERTFKEYMKTSYAEKSRNIFLGVSRDDEFQKFIQKQAEERANLFKTIPVNLANHVTTNISKWSVQGMTSKEVSYKLREYIPNLLESQVKTIARTETSKTLIGLTSYKSIKNNIPCYQWKASGGYSGDGRTRNSHRHMSDVIIFWNDPPAPEDLFPTGYRNTLGHYHAGCCPNCRCVAMPVVFVEDLKFPVRVYQNGTITKMNKIDFLKLYNGKINELKAENAQKKLLNQKPKQKIKNNTISKKESKEIKVNAEKSIIINNINVASKLDDDYVINRDYIRKDDFKNDCLNIVPANPKLCEGICKLGRKILKRRKNYIEDNIRDAKEEIHILNINGKEIVRPEINPEKLLDNEAKFNKEQDAKALEFKNKRYSYYVIHNHPTNSPPSLNDFIHILKYGYTFGIIICHNGDIYKYYRKSNTNYDNSDWEKWKDEIKKDTEATKNLEESWIKIFLKYGLYIERISAKKEE